MNQDTYMKIADEISDKLISLCLNNKTKNKSLMQLYNELLNEEYFRYSSNILAYIPDQLAQKGYEIVDPNNFEIKKY